MRVTSRDALVKKGGRSRRTGKIRVYVCIPETRAGRSRHARTHECVYLSMYASGTARRQFPLPAAKTAGLDADKHLGK